MGELWNRSFQGILALSGTVLGLWMYAFGWQARFIVLVFAVFVVLAAFEGRRRMPTTPRIARWILELWVFAPIIFGAGATLLILLASLELPVKALLLSQTPLRSRPPSKDDIDTIIGVVRGSIVGYVSFVALKDIGEGGGIFSVSSQFKSAIGSVPFNYEVPERVADAMIRESIRGEGRIGWGFSARGKRARVLSEHLANPKTQSGTPPP